MGFKLIPLSQDAKTPTVKTTNEIYVDPKYWTAEKIESENYRFKNVATTFGITNIKDEEGIILFKNERLITNAYTPFHLVFIIISILLRVEWNILLQKIQPDFVAVVESFELLLILYEPIDTRT
jgi:hypothetical protein